MNKRENYHVLKSLVDRLTVEERAEIERARVEILAIAGRSTSGFIGLCLAGSEYAQEGENQP